MGIRRWEGNPLRHLAPQHHRPIRAPRWFCTDNVCTHAFALLTEGWLEGHLIECPLHNGQFDVRTGKGMGAPITEDLRTYAVKIEGNDVLVALP